MKSSLNTYSGLTFYLHILEPRPALMHDMIISMEDTVVFLVVSKALSEWHLLYRVAQNTIGFSCIFVWESFFPGPPCINRQTML